MIAVVDYGAGNLFSVANALQAIGAEFRFASEPTALRGADKILLPGVGHFGQMMGALDERDLREALLGAVKEGTPILGICLGMQALYEWSEEAPGVAGLGLIAGTVRALPSGCRVPHMGWNTVRFASGEDVWCYFANSFAAPVSGATWGTTEYGGAFSSAVRKGNLSGFQFHPEKSGAKGLELIARWCRDAG